MTPRSWVKRSAGLAGVAGVLAVALAASFSFANNRDPDNLHWGAGNDNIARVTFVDHTGPDWPVHAAADKWDSAGRLDVDYRLDTCNNNPHCVSVDTQQFAQPCTQEAGRSFLVPSGNGNHLHENTHIRMNSKCNINHPSSELRVIACHEEGHVTGVFDEPQPQNDTCMELDTNLNQDNTPRQHDFVMLDDVIYDHND